MLLHEQPDQAIGQYPAPLFVSVPPEYAQHTEPYGSDSEDRVKASLLYLNMQKEYADTKR